MTGEMKVTIASDIDRDLLSAELAHGGEDWGYLYEQEGRLVLEIYPRQDGKPWVFSLDELLSTLAQAKLKLVGSSSEPT